MKSAPDNLLIRKAELTDLPALHELIPLSVRTLGREFYSEQQIESSIRHVFGPDTQLIHDRTYYVAAVDGQIVGCGGWSKRLKIYGGDQTQDDSPLLDPKVDAARIRAFFVHPAWARRGLGSGIANLCIQEARAAGFTRFELVGTLPGLPLYHSLGFEVVERVHPVLPDGVQITFVRMAARDSKIGARDIDAGGAKQYG